MKNTWFSVRIIGSLIAMLFCFKASAQPVMFEWRLTNPTYNAADPDGGGPAMGSATFTVQIRSLGPTIPISTITIGWSYTDANAITPAGCSISASTPSNVSIAPAFAGWGFNTVNQCNNFAQAPGGQVMDRRVAGTFESASELGITSTWTDMFTVTMWSRQAGAPYAGYVALNSGVNGAPGPFGTYALSNALGDEFGANSLSFASPLLLGPSVPTPVTFTGYNVTCGDRGTLITWTTGSEVNSSHYEIERSTDGTNWVRIDNVRGAGNSTTTRNYQYLDLQGGDAFYRIKQVDLDGRYVHTAVKRVSCNSRNITVALFPVPTPNILNIAVRSDKMIRTDLQVIDMSGRIVKRQSVVINNGNTNLTLDLSNLPSGEYLLTGSDQTLPLNKKFTIAR